MKRGRRTWVEDVVRDRAEKKVEGELSEAALCARSEDGVALYCFLSACRSFPYFCSSLDVSYLPTPRNTQRSKQRISSLTTLWPKNTFNQRQHTGSLEQV